MFSNNCVNNCLYLNPKYKVQILLSSPHKTMQISYAEFGDMYEYRNKWHGIVVSMMAYGPEDLGLIPRLAKVHNDVIFLLGVFMIQFNLI